MPTTCDLTLVSHVSYGGLKQGCLERVQVQWTQARRRAVRAARRQRKTGLRSSCPPSFLPILQQQQRLHILRLGIWKRQLPAKDLFGRWRIYPIPTIEIIYRGVSSFVVVLFLLGPEAAGNVQENCPFIWSAAAAAGSDPELARYGNCCFADLSRGVGGYCSSRWSDLWIGSFALLFIFICLRDLPPESYIFVRFWVQ